MCWRTPCVLRMALGEPPSTSGGTRRLSSPGTRCPIAWRRTVPALEVRSPQLSIETFFAFLFISWLTPSALQEFVVRSRSPPFFVCKLITDVVLTAAPGDGFLFMAVKALEDKSPRAGPGVASLLGCDAARRGVGDARVTHRRPAHRAKRRAALPRVGLSL